ncbi:unnamed protein product [Spirodela intermedia]|uniref:FAD-binding PCMH-type domain-containing protein n=1 Tax=Spirodela intermedia TaxID=51605 RepID=A0A7I8I851_SPIIN|nr:unnamed protein product [Spirodela intermedia]CAA6653769.1 unnamed protein product [Spirodela intermedia]
MKAQSLVFAINGERFELASVDPATTLLSSCGPRRPTRGPSSAAEMFSGFPSSIVILQSAGFLPFSRGCGACVVLLSKYEPLSGEIEDLSVSSCLTLLCSVHLCSVTTTEGLGSSKGSGGFHPIHRRIAGFHASQCGFCTPGVCMSIFSALVNADKAPLTVAEAEKAVAGNLCRCTGYRPIVDVCKSFAGDVDLEDLGLNSFWRVATVDMLPSYSLGGGIGTFPDFLKAEINASLLDSAPEIPQSAIASSFVGSWYAPKSLGELHSILRSEGPGNRLKLVAGNTAAGVYKEVDRYDRYVDLRLIPELNEIRGGDPAGFVEIGAAVSISRAAVALEREGGAVFCKLATHLRKVAAEFVRNTASIGGNLVMAQRGKFPSDVATIFLGAGASVSIEVGFLRDAPIDAGKLLLSVRLPSWAESAGGERKSKLVFETFRAAPRELGNAVAYVNAAFLARVAAGEASGGSVVESLRLAFGAYGGRHATRAKKVEEFLTGKPVNSGVMLEVIRLLREDISPEEGTDHAAYRVSAAAGFLFKFLLQLEEEHGGGGSVRAVAGEKETLLLSTGFQNEHISFSNGEVSAVDRSGSQREKLPPSRQAIEGSSTEYHPVGQAVKKVGAEIQASGEAVYVDDIPSPIGCLHGAFVYGTRPLVPVKEVNLKNQTAAATEEPVAFISVRDIPSGGKNIGAGIMAIFGDDPLFGSSCADYAGQPLGLVVAETQRAANAIARKAEVVYEGEITGPPPIMSVEEAVERNSLFDVPPFLQPTSVGDFDQAMEEADRKILSAQIVLGSQYYFYMETQTALAVPDEDDCMVVYSSSQSPERTQKIIAQCLGLPQHNVRVITRRVGGGFGGKAVRSIPVATACALAAFKLRRPVRMYLDRKTDMVLFGGVQGDGEDHGAANGDPRRRGATPDLSPIMPLNISGALKKYDWGALSMDFKICKTNRPTRSAMRGPGEVQGTFIAEAVVEHVADELAVDPEAVREVNMHTFDSLRRFHGPSAGDPPEFTLPAVFSRVVATAELRRRREEVRRFNGENRWRKRGISHVPILQPVSLRPTPAKVGVLGDGSVVVEVGGVELGQGLWTKVAQMAAYALGHLLDEGGALTFSIVLIQGGITAGSTTSESSCEAVRIACNELVARLMPLKNRLLEQLGSSLTWDLLIGQAAMVSVNLSASTLFCPQGQAVRYINYGAAVSEVEVDLLTGATKILRSDLAYDGGRSLNPAVDLGQIEGAFVQGLGFFMSEEYLSNSEGLVTTEGTWDYKIPTVDTIPKQFNVELISSGHHQHRVLSSKGRRSERRGRSWRRWGAEPPPAVFQLDVPATMPVVKKLCGYDNVERHLEAALCR